MPGSAYVCKPVTQAYFQDWLGMGSRLWPRHTESELEPAFRKILKSPREKAFICLAENGTAVGFANVSLRVDYVEGSKSSPVGYLEGIFVEKEYRNQGIARILLEEGERWARQKGAKEMGSDAELKNVESQKFHRAVGFKEANRNVHYVKKISTGGRDAGSARKAPLETI